MDDTLHVLIVEARFYEDIADELVKGAIAELEGAGATHERVSVPGAFELPAAIRFAIKGMHLVGARRRYDAYIALGCVIRGETTHYDYICGQSARALMDLSLQYTIALGYGILTTETREQAWQRARVDGRNKGAVAARAALRMIDLKRHFGFHPR